MEQTLSKPIVMRPKATHACEVCRVARKRCDYDKDRPAQPCPLCAKRGVGCSLTASAAQPQPATVPATVGPSLVYSPNEWGGYFQG